MSFYTFRCSNIKIDLSFTVYRENAGLLALTRVGSRRVVQIAAGFMIFFSILGKSMNLFNAFILMHGSSCFHIDAWFIFVAGILFLTSMVQLRIIVQENSGQSLLQFHHPFLPLYIAFSLLTWVCISWYFGSQAAVILSDIFWLVFFNDLSFSPWLSRCWWS